MGRMYSATFELVAATAAQDLFEINAPADAAVVVPKRLSALAQSLPSLGAELVGEALPFG